MYNSRVVTTDIITMNGKIRRTYGIGDHGASQECESKKICPRWHAFPRQTHLGPPVSVVFSSSNQIIIIVVRVFFRITITPNQETMSDHGKIKVIL
jgi:hypothetical protein